jgi:hypothetical protein
LDAVVCSNFYNVQCRLSKLTLSKNPLPFTTQKTLKASSSLREEFVVIWPCIGSTFEDIKKLTPSPTAHPLRAFFIVRSRSKYFDIFYIFSHNVLQIIVYGAGIGVNYDQNLLKVFLEYISRIYSKEYIRTEHILHLFTAI